MLIFINLTINNRIDDKKIVFSINFVVNKNKLKIQLQT